MLRQMRRRIRGSSAVAVAADITRKHDSNDNVLNGHELRGADVQASNSSSKYGSSSWPSTAHFNCPFIHSCNPDNNGFGHSETYSKPVRRPICQQRPTTTTSSNIDHHHQTDFNTIDHHRNAALLDVAAEQKSLELWNAQEQKLKDSCASATAVVQWIAMASNDPMFRKSRKPRLVNDNSHRTTPSLSPRPSPQHQSARKRMLFQQYYGSSVNDYAPTPKQVVLAGQQQQQQQQQPLLESCHHRAAVPPPHPHHLLNNFSRDNSTPAFSRPARVSALSTYLFGRFS
jgi:hypothetical protein